VNSRDRSATDVAEAVGDADCVPWLESLDTSVMRKRIAECHARTGGKRIGSEKRG
jgi:hypothetical protein